MVEISASEAGTRDVQARTEHAAFRGTSSLCVFSSWHLPKVLIRKSAIRACSGASTLKDQYLGQVPGGGGEKKKRARGAPYQKNTIFWLSCWRGPREPKKSAIVLIFRTAQNLSAEGERHGTSHQLQQPIRRQRDAPPHGFIHTPPPQPRTKTSRATRKRPPMSSVPTSISGLVDRIHRCHRCNPGSIPG